LRGRPSIINLPVEKSNLIELTEIDRNENHKPVVGFKIANEKLIGQWRGDGRFFSFDAAP
jgi:hypothetical protein